MKEIPLTKGKVATVSNNDYQYLSQWKWSAHKNGNTFYAVRMATDPNGKRKFIYMHRVVGKRAGRRMNSEIDHKNRNGLDNQRSNLRAATHKQGGENQSVRKDNTSGHRGVYKHKRTGKWVAQIKHNGRNIYLGLYVNLKKAVSARRAAEKKYFDLP